MADAITVPEHLTTEFKLWLAHFGLNVIEHVGAVPTRYEIRIFGGGEAPLHDVCAGDTIVWDRRSNRMSVRRNRPVPTAKGRIMDVARERGLLYEVTLGHIGADSDADIVWLLDVLRTVLDLVSQGLIELRETPDGEGDTGQPLTGQALQAALADPAALIGSPESMRMIRLSLASDAP